MTDNEAAYVDAAGLKIDGVLHAFLTREAIPGSGVDEAQFWRTLAALIREFTPRNQALLRRRADLQTQIDRYEMERRGCPRDGAAYRNFLSQIGYIAPEGPTFSIATKNVDPEIAHLAGPQLVVPLSNARYALNAANARWGSLYDALYGTDAILDPPPQGGYDREHGAQVVAYAKRFLDETVPLANGSHAEVRRYRVEAGELIVDLSGAVSKLAERSQFAGHQGDCRAPSAVLFRHHDLHIELVIDAKHMAGVADPAHVADIRLEAALTSIMDAEDSVAAVDGADKAAVYRTWLGLMQGDLTEQFEKGGRRVDRGLSADRVFIAPGGAPLRLRGRALMLMRNVGHLMTTPAVLAGDGNEVFEGLLDAAVTVLIGLHDLRKPADAAIRNSRTGSLYVVKPKMHGPEEVTFASHVFAQLEDAYGIARNTVKIGLMDEERRTSVNLFECIRAAKDRICFVNTGFLDRTGDEIHTSMQAGPMKRKADIKAQPWFGAYERRNVAIALACGFRGRAQIGKGMWAKPDRMADMLAEKIEHPNAGASTAWVPSPTSAVLHALHYHRVDVSQRQDELASYPMEGRDKLLMPPLEPAPAWSDAEIGQEIDNNVQSILGYVVRWVDQGVGCSKVPDINGVGLMEDRATCRISSQMIANWLHHGIVAPQAVLDSMKRMAAVVDVQNAANSTYEAMAPAFDSAAFRAAHDLIFTGTKAPSGYTEIVLTTWRQVAKRRRLAPIAD